MKIALYSRVSTIDQDPEMQKRALINKAEREGWDYELFEERESTRKTRPIKNNLYLRLLNKEYDGVCIWKVDRWARSSKELSNDIELLHKKGIKFISLNDPIHLDSDVGWAQFQIICIFAELERRFISTRTREGLAAKKKNIEEQGYFINKKGKKVTKLGRPKGSKDKKVRRKSGYYRRWSENK